MSADMRLSSLDGLAITTIPTLAMDAVELAVSLGWDRYVGPRGATIARQPFGASASYADLRAKFGLTVDHPCERARALLSARKERS